MLLILGRFTQPCFAQTPKALPVDSLSSVVFIESRQRAVVILSERPLCSAPILAV